MSKTTQQKGSAWSGLGFFEPQIHFSSSCMRDWIRNRLTPVSLCQQMDDLRRAVKVASEYYWDNAHFFIDDIYGRPALKISVSPDGTISLWSAQKGTSYGDVGNSLMLPAESVMNELIRHASEGKVRCGECSAFGLLEEDGGSFHRYSFAGSVCAECYDPARHKGPDTRGD